MSRSIKLYKNHIHGIGYWEIWPDGSDIHIEHATTVHSDSPVHHLEHVYEGKQGRTLDQQVQHRIQSRVNKQLDKGYVRTIEEAQEHPTNALNLLQPMLAQPLKRVNNIDILKHYVQMKYDGHRCLITKHNGEIVAYSRQGKIIDTIPHILKDIDIPEGVTLDGELYCHGQSLQTIASWAKRFQPSTMKLNYIVYDVLLSGEIYKNRLQWLKETSLGWSGQHTIVAPTWRLDKELLSELHNAKDWGYEGLILRNENRGYEAGRRSSSLIKVKSCMDAEFPVVDIVPSKKDWGILICMLPSGDTFRTSAPGTIEEKTEILRNKENYIGKVVTVEFAEYTKDKVPFHCVATGFREDI